MERGHLGIVTVKSEGEGLPADQAGAPPSWVFTKIATGAPITFGESDRLGQWVLGRWRAALVPAETGRERWGIMGALAWIATREIDLARRAAYFDGHAFKPKAQPSPVRPGVVRLGRPAAPRGDPKRRHEWAALTHEVFAHCSCQPRPTEWSDCRCLDRALDQVRATIEAGELRGYAWTGDSSRRVLMGADLIGLHRPASGLPWLALANGASRVEFVPLAVQGAFPRELGSASAAEIEDWIRGWLCANRTAERPGSYEEPWTVFHALPRFAGCNREDYFMPAWRNVTGNRKQGRPAKLG